LMLQFKEGCPCACGNGTEATSSGLHWSEEDVKELIADLFPGKDAIDSNGKSRERREQKQWSDWPIDEHGRPLY